MSWQRHFDPSTLARLEPVLADGRLAGSCAAFDADGTLWAGDVGELVLQSLIGLGRVPPEVWSRYEALLPVDAPAACALCVEVMRGATVAELERWSHELVQARQHGPLFSATVELARELERRGCEVWIVSGSNAWTVGTAIAAAGLNASRVLGLTSPAPEGVLSGVVDRPLTCARGKVEALRRRTDKPLVLAAGNALYDVDLLEHAELPLAVAPRGKPTALRELAMARKWSIVDVEG
ncbi:MAG: haloacid dehalogenase-like hydrolase [Deltaproteobacteria bacterium]|nr:haloacid dehalogenase-like hydrolase [Deltaproteobacteria bacterium]